MFETVYSSASIGAKKPEAAFYDHIVSDLHAKHGVAKEEVFFFDDDEDNIEGAKAYGLPCVRYENIGQLKSVLAEHGLSTDVS